jgi:hypothetical protein
MRKLLLQVSLLLLEVKELLVHLHRRREQARTARLAKKKSEKNEG